MTANGTGSRTWAPMGRLRSGAVPTYCDVSVDTRMAPGDGDAGPHHPSSVERRSRGKWVQTAPQEHTTLRGTITPPPVRTCMRLSVSDRASECPISADIVVSRRHPGIHRHPTAQYVGNSAILHSSDDPQEPESASQSRSRPRRLSVIDLTRCCSRGGLTANGRGRALGLGLPWVV